MGPPPPSPIDSPPAPSPSLRCAPARVTYREFNAGHMDLTFAVRDEVRAYVLARLLLGRHGVAVPARAGRGA